MLSSSKDSLSKAGTELSPDSPKYGSARSQRAKDSFFTELRIPPTNTPKKKITAAGEQNIPDLPTVSHLPGATSPIKPETIAKAKTLSSQSDGKGSDTEPSTSIHTSCR